MKPRGILIAIGGNEEKSNLEDERFLSDFGDGQVLRQIMKQAGGRKARIEIITTASSIPAEVGANYRDAFADLRAENIGILNIRSRKDVEKTASLKRIEEADAIMFSGGDQIRLSKVFLKTRAYDIIKSRYLNDDFVVAGTSAGAMIMSEEMIAGGKHEAAFKKGGIIMGKGLGLLETVIFDTHFIQRGRFGRLAEAVALHPDKLGMGLGEDTGLIIRDGNTCEVIGSGMVIIFDGSDFSYNHCPSLKEDAPVSLGNLRVHVLAPGDKYHIAEKQMEIHQNTKSPGRQVSKSL